MENSIELTRLNAGDFEEAMDFLNLVFSMAHEPHDFARMLPIIYRPTEEHMKCNYAVKEQGKIRGIVGVFPAEMKVGKHVLKVGGIGGVSAHPADKGKGWMKLLMGKALEEMRASGTDLSWLGGLRQRYQYFGYEKTGVMFDAKISETNMRHAYGNAEMTLKMTAMKESDGEYLDKAKELYDQQPIRCERSREDFWLFLTAVFTTPWVALDAAGNVVGYMVVNHEKNTINEIFAEDEDILIQMLRVWMKQEQRETLNVKLAPWQKSAIQKVSLIAETFYWNHSGNFQIFNWEKVVGSFLEMKNEKSTLLDGTLCLEVKEYGTLHIEVNKGEVRCRKTEEKADQVLDEFTACRVLFGHCPMHYVTDVQLNTEKRILLENWFPLPLCWLIQNHV